MNAIQAKKKTASKKRPKIVVTDAMVDAAREVFEEYGNYLTPDPTGAGLQIRKVLKRALEAQHQGKRHRGTR